MESTQIREPWNKDKLVGQKRPLKPKDIWAIRIHLQNARRDRDLAMFNLAIDSKLRGCDLVNLRVRDIANGNQILPRAMVVQRKTATARAIRADRADQSRSRCLDRKGEADAGSVLVSEPPVEGASCFDAAVRSDRPSVGWAIGLDPAVYGTHTMRRTKATLIYKRTKNLRAVQLLLGHTKLEARFAISASKSMTPWRFRNRPKSSGHVAAT
jgi:integrase